MLRWILIIIITAGFQAHAFSPYKQSLEKVKHRFYSIGYDESKEGAAWTYHLLTKELVGGGVKRGNYFRFDPKVSTGSADKDDYRGSGFDRGHLVPAGDMKLSKTSMKESFFMSNMLPQRPSFNRGVWRRLENRVRRFVSKSGNTHVFTGPIFTEKEVYLNGTMIRIPDLFYKILYFEKSQKAIAFIIPNEKQSSKLLKFSSTIDKVEKLTGIDFLWELSDNLEDRIESQIDKNFWSDLN